MLGRGLPSPEEEQQEVSCLVFPSTFSTLGEAEWRGLLSSGLPPTTILHCNRRVCEYLSSAVGTAR